MKNAPLPLKHRRLSWIWVLVLFTSPWANAATLSPFSFSLYAPHAKYVEVLGDFNQWQSGATPLTGPDEKGMWRSKVTLPVTGQRVEYIYSADGIRVVNPQQPVIPDGFSGENNVLLFP